MLLSVDGEEGQVISTAKVGDSLSKKLSSTEWIKHINNPDTNGKGGGTATSASGFNKSIDRINELVELALNFGIAKLR